MTKHDCVFLNCAERERLLTLRAEGAEARESELKEGLDNARLLAIKLAQEGTAWKAVAVKYVTMTDELARTREGVWPAIVGPLIREIWLKQEIREHAALRDAILACDLRAAQEAWRKRDDD